MVIKDLVAVRTSLFGLLVFGFKPLETAGFVEDMAAFRDSYNGLILIELVKAYDAVLLVKSVDFYVILGLD